MSDHSMKQKVRKRRRVALLLRDGNHCRYCGRQGGFRSSCQVRLTIDHIRPISRGGSNDLTNLQLLCLECNQLKADLFDVTYEPA